MFYDLHDKVTLLTRRRSEHETRACQQIMFRKVWITYIQNVDQEMNF